MVFIDKGGIVNGKVLCEKMILNGARFYNIQESLLYFRFSRETIKKRGGFKYAVSDVKSQIGFYRMGFLRPVDLCYNIAP